MVSNGNQWNQDEAADWGWGQDDNASPAANENDPQDEGWGAGGWDQQVAHHDPQVEGELQL